MNFSLTNFHCSQINYKKGHKEQKLQFTSLADRPDIEMAKKVSQQLSDVSLIKFILFYVDSSLVNTKADLLILYNLIWLTVSNEFYFLDTSLLNHNDINAVTNDSFFSIVNILSRIPLSGIPLQLVELGHP